MAIAGLPGEEPLEATFRERLNVLASEYEDLQARHCALRAFSDHLQAKMGGTDTGVEKGQSQVPSLLLGPRAPPAPSYWAAEEFAGGRWPTGAGDDGEHESPRSNADDETNSASPPSPTSPKAAAGGAAEARPRRGTAWPVAAAKSKSSLGATRSFSSSRFPSERQTRVASLRRSARTTASKSLSSGDRVIASLKRLGLADFEEADEATREMLAVDDTGLDKRVQKLWHIFSDLDSSGNGALGAQDLARYKVPGTEPIPVENLEVAIVGYNQFYHPDLAGEEATRISFATFARLLLDDNAEFEVCEDVAQSIRGLRSIFLVSDATEMILHQMCLRTNDLKGLDRKESVLKKVDALMSLAIVVNAILLGVSVDTPWGGWNYVESLFAVMFTSELVLKINLVGCREFFMGDDVAWNLVDAFIVLVAILDVMLWMLGSLIGDADFSSLTVVRLVRLCRLSRFLRLLRVRAFKELTLIINGMMSGLRTLFWANILFLVLIYILGLFLAQTLGLSESPECMAGRMGCPQSKDAFDSQREQLFHGVLRAMFTVFRCLTSDCTLLGGDSLVMHMLEIYGWPVAITYVLLILFVCFGLFNLIMAIFVETTLENARHDEQRRKAYRRAEHIRLAQKLQRLLLSFSNGATDVQVDRQGFELLIADPAVIGYLDDLDVAKFNRQDLFDILDADGNGRLDMQECINGILKMRGTADKSDMVATYLAVKAVHKSLRSMETLVMSNMRVIFETLNRYEGFAPELSRNGSGSVAWRSNRSGGSVRGSVAG